MSGWVTAVLVALTGLALTSFWFGVSRRRRAEAEIGVQSLANLKWRESISLVLEWLQRDGHQLLADSAAGGTEFLLGQGNDKVLLDYKHGTAYRIGEASVREFENALRLRGASRGILVTLGSIEGRASQLAAGVNIQLIDGAHLWSHVRPYVSEGVLSAVRSEAAAATRKGLWLGALASVLAGAAFLVIGNPLVARPVPTAAPVGATAIAGSGSTSGPTAPAPWWVSARPCKPHSAMPTGWSTPSRGPACNVAATLAIER